jgi:hypothetical protein
MRNLVLAAAAFAALAGGALASPPSPPPDSNAAEAAAKAFDALKGEYDEATRAYNDAYRSAKTDAERRAAAELRPKPADWSPKFKALAAKYPTDAAAAECLAWIVQNDRTTAAQEAALNDLMAKHLASKVIAGVCASVQNSQAANAESFLRAVATKSQDHEAQGRASFSLACHLNSGKQTPASAKEAEKLFELVAEKYADLSWYGESTLGVKAKAELFEMRNLAVGKTAPEITGEDENGKQMKLSDFRGKAVLLDFWGYW